MTSVPDPTLPSVSPLSGLDVSREVVKCRACGLNQFTAASRHCLRCHVDLFPPVEVVAIVAIESEELKANLPRHMASGPVNIGAAVRLIRLVKNLSQRDLALRMGTPRTYVSKVENAACVPTIDNIKRIADALGVQTHLFVRIAETLLSAD